MQNLRSKALELAHQIKSQFESWGNAQKAAWKIIKLQAGIQQEIQFAKETGEVREATAMAVSSLSSIEKGFVRFVEKISANRTQWRSFRLERLILN